MSNKFSVLGSIVGINDEAFKVNVRRNFKDYSNEYFYDILNIKTSLGISPTVIQHMSIGDLVFVSGRLEHNEIDTINLIAEHITLSKDLSL